MEGIPCPRGDTDCHQWLHEPQRGIVLDPLAEISYIKMYVFMNMMS